MAYKISPKYMFTEKDPRNIPLNQCASLGDLMATLEKCERLNKKDKRKKK